MPWLPGPVPLLPQLASLSTAPGEADREADGNILRTQDGSQVPPDPVHCHPCRDAVVVRPITWIGLGAAPGISGACLVALGGLWRRGRGNLIRLPVASSLLSLCFALPPPSHPVAPALDPVTMKWIP